MVRHLKSVVLAWREEAVKRIILIALGLPVAFVACDTRAAQCHENSSPVVYNAADGLSPRKGGYACRDEHGTVYIELAVADQDVPKELRIQADGNTSVRDRPAARLGDLLNANLLTPQLWAEDAMRAEVRAGRSYALEIDNFATQTVDACLKEMELEASDQERFVWLGRVLAGGMAAYNLVISPSETNALASCFVERVKSATLPEPPRPSYYDRLGGHPVAYQWNPPPKR